MDAGMAAFAGVVAAGALAGFAAYRWRVRARARRVGWLVRDYLAGRYGALPGGLHVDCSDDELWPVLVAFDDPATGARRRLRFAHAGPHSGLALLAEGVDATAAAQAVRAAEDRADAARFDDGGRPPGHGQADWQNRQDEVGADAAAAGVAARP